MTGGDSSHGGSRSSPAPGLEQARALADAEATVWRRSGRGCPVRELLPSESSVEPGRYPEKLVDIEPGFIEPPRDVLLALGFAHRDRRATARNALRHCPVSAVLVLPSHGKLETFAAPTAGDIDGRGSAINDDARREPPSRAAPEPGERSSGTIDDAGHSQSRSTSLTTSRKCSGSSASVP